MTKVSETSRPKIRLFVDGALAAGQAVELGGPQAHYLGTVLRVARGEAVAVFNGRDGEWRAAVDGIGRGWCSLAVQDKLRAQETSPDLWLVFSPVKRARIDYVAAKATELGVAALCPVITRHTAVGRVNTERLRANAIEAAEQCGRLDVPEVAEPVTLDSLLADWPAGRRLAVCDETGRAPPIEDALAPFAGRPPGPWAVLTGPEGGFAEAELDALAKTPFVIPVGLGPRILRADTASVAALACWQARLGDWHSRRPMGGADA
jgi:16S rRNA (uracil1498-N3)-methyltransferase